MTFRKMTEAFETKLAEQEKRHAAEMAMVQQQYAQPRRQDIYDRLAKQTDIMAEQIKVKEQAIKTLQDYFTQHEQQQQWQQQQHMNIDRKNSANLHFERQQYEQRKLDVKAKKSEIRMLRKQYTEDLKSRDAQLVKLNAKHKQLKNQYRILDAHHRHILEAHAAELSTRDSTIAEKDRMLHELTIELQNSTTILNGRSEYIDTLKKEKVALNDSLETAREEIYILKKKCQQFDEK